MTSIVIAAHNEAAVIGRCLDTLLAETSPGEFEVVVVANGCTDSTAEEAAARAGVRVLELEAAGKVAALNAGDAAAVKFPRVFLDADIVISTDGVRALRDALVTSGAGSSREILAAVPRREVDVSRSPLPVRAYYAINTQLPVFRSALFGRGVIALSEEGRSRFERFPNVLADDLFLDSLFSTAERCEVDTVSARVAAPRRTRDLLRRLVRVRRGNSSIRAASSAGGYGGYGEVRRAARTSWLRDVAMRDPALLPAATCYVAITIMASILARLPAKPDSTWGRDDSSRQDGETASGLGAADG